MPVFTGLWKQPDFRKLWLGQSVSLLGSQFTTLALPLTAVLVLHASPAQMGILGAAQFAPFLVLTLFAGVWVDRLRRRPILILTDLGRLVLLGSVPVVALLGFLSMVYLYTIALATGVLSVFFEVASQAYLPELVEREQLTEGNTRLEVSRSLAQIVGPGLAGFLVQLVTPPLALAVDALSFGASAWSVWQIKSTAKPAPERANGQHSLWAEIREGFQALLGNVITRSLILCGTTRSFFSSLMGAVLTLYMVQELKLAPFGLGLVSAVSGVGTLVGALLAAEAARRFGLGRTLVTGALVVGLGNLLVPAAQGATLLAVVVLTLGLFIASLAAPFYGVNQISLRQTITPEELQGRVNASVRFMAWGSMPLGSLAGGFLGQSFGLHLTLLVGALGTLASFLWIFFSPVRTLTKPPASILAD